MNAAENDRLWSGFKKKESISTWWEFDRNITQPTETLRYYEERLEIYPIV